VNSATGRDPTPDAMLAAQPAISISPTHVPTFNHATVSFIWRYRT
jgi:hypothetical protein